MLSRIQILSPKMYLYIYIKIKIFKRFKAHLSYPNFVPDPTDLQKTNPNLMVKNNSYRQHVQFNKKRMTRNCPTGRVRKNPGFSDKTQPTCVFLGFIFFLCFFLVFCVFHYCMNFFGILLIFWGIFYFKFFLSLYFINIKSVKNKFLTDDSYFKSVLKY